MMEFGVVLSLSYTLRILRYFQNPLPVLLRFFRMHHRVAMSADQHIPLHSDHALLVLRVLLGLLVIDVREENVLGEVSGIWFRMFSGRGIVTNSGMKPRDWRGCE
jgi:hypothetical protein